MVPRDLKVLIQIPCLNEEENLLEVLNSIPKDIDGISNIKVVVIDDASTDRSVELADAHGVDFIILKSRTRGLADSFRLGQEFFLSSGFDILVNTDGDNQYNQDKIGDLLGPIIAGTAEVVVGDRGTWKLNHFSLAKRVLQKVGSVVLSSVARSRVPDAASGFRAYSRVAIANIFITTKFSYAMESIIQVGNKGLPIASIFAGAKPVQRPSRLFRSSSQHVKNSATAILKGFLMYQPLKIFSWLGFVLFAAGLIPMVRYLALQVTGSAGSHFQSLLLGSLLISLGVISLVLGLLGQLSRVHRELHEQQIAIARLSQRGADFESTLELYGARLQIQGNSACQ
ncbi:glycosyltransferase family 2 protein [Aquiluna sp.]|nr:glycosyltransferase family 2 protein [Aquiluna sp.]